VAAASAARNNSAVVTTLAALAAHAVADGDTALAGEVERLNRANLGVLQQSGVDIAIGSDDYSGTSVEEALYLATLGALDHAAVLRAWSETTPRVIHPDRRIGRLHPGYEASFLVLDGDPLVDFSNVTRIRSAVKLGQPVPRQ
jgi:imidazolonepropionase-like amidohydrolase